MSSHVGLRERGGHVDLARFAICDGICGSCSGMHADRTLVEEILLLEDLDDLLGEIVAGEVTVDGERWCHDDEQCADQFL